MKIFNWSAMIRIRPLKHQLRFGVHRRRAEKGVQEFRSQEATRDSAEIPPAPQIRRTMTTRGLIDRESPNNFERA